MERLKNNWQWKLVSLLAGFLLWSYITAGINPNQKTTIRDIEVEIINQEVLSQTEYMVTNLEPKMVSVVVMGKRNALASLEKMKVKAVIDATDLREGRQNVNIRYELPADITLSEAGTTSCTLDLEKIVRRSVKVTTQEVGKLEDDYVLEGVFVSPQRVEVVGPRSKVDSISRIAAKVDINGLTEDQSSNVKISPLNSEGEPVDSLQLSLSSVNVSLSILKQKKLPIKLDLKGTPKEDYKIVEAESTPNQVLVRGKKDVIDELKEIKSEPIDASVIKESENREIKLTFPGGVESVNGVASTLMTLRVETLQDQVVEFPLDMVNIDELPEDQKEAWKTKKGHIAITLKAFPEDFEKLKKEDITVAAKMEAGEVEKIVYKVEVDKEFSLVKTAAVFEEN